MTKYQFTCKIQFIANRIYELIKQDFCLTKINLHRSPVNICKKYQNLVSTKLIIIIY